MKPLIVIRHTPKIDFMRWHMLGFAFSGLLTVLSVVLFLTVGLNYGIDFVGGTLIEVRVDDRAGRPRRDAGEARCAAYRRGLSCKAVRQPPTDVLIRLPQQPGGDAAQKQAVAAGARGARAGYRISPRSRWSGRASAAS